MAWNDLINSTYANQHLPGSPNTTLRDSLITACSLAITRYCKRQFVQQTYDELYNGRGERALLLRNYPLISVESVRYRPVTALKITNNLANTPQARVSVTKTGLKLVRVTSGVTTTDTSVTFAGNVTVLAIQNAVNGLGSGWSSSSAGYDQWGSADFYCPNGISGTNDPGVEGQGALSCPGGSFAELKLHTFELQGWQPDTRQGWLLRAIPYTDPELLHPEDLIWPVGVNNFRIQYTAGYATIPDDVQEAAAEYVSYLYYLATRDPALTHQVPSGGTTSAWGAVITGKYGPPETVRALLSNYRHHGIGIPGG
jgi:hypothetical protein